MSENAFTSELTGEALARNALVEPAEIVADQISSALAQFQERAAALVASATARTVTDNDEIGKAADIRSMIQTLSDAIWARAREVADPHNRAVAVAKTRTERFLVDLVAADTALSTKIADCRNLQRQRAAAQREQQRQQEAALRAAEHEVVNPQIDSTPISLPAVKGDYGSRVGDRAVTTYVYPDPRKLPREVLDAPAVEKAIQATLRVYMKIHPKTKGVTAQAGVTTSHRRPN